MGRDYDRFTARSSKAACKYKVALVVTRAPTTRPKWLVPVYRNVDFVVSRLAKGACRLANAAGQPG